MFPAAMPRAMAIPGGPISTTKILGKMQSTSGKRIFIVVFAANSSALWRRF